MKVAYYAIHYGKEYLAWSIRSIQDAVDAIYIFYTDVPSYGFKSPYPCPDTREELKAQALRFATKPVYWIEGRWNSEHHHREEALRTIQQKHGPCQVLVVDADEIWPEGHAAMALEHVANSNSAYAWMANFWNFWRSFDYMVLDAFAPIRVVDQRHRAGSTGRLPDHIKVLHFGYAQCENLMGYKWTCHGHQAELRPGWRERFVKWQPGDADLHPVVNNLWDKAHPTPPEVRLEIDKIMKDHPYYGIDVISSIPGT